MEEGDGHSGFAEAVRAWRQRRGWTQEELSHASGLSTRAIRSLERGRTLSPRRTTVQMLADALQVPKARLMGTVRRGWAADGEAEAGNSAGAMEATVRGPEPRASDEGAHRVPRELPPDLTDPDVEAREVVAALLAAPSEPYRAVLVTVEDPRASELAIRAAHQAAPKFPDGQLYARLTGTPPTPPAAILRRFLRSLDVAERPGDASAFAADELAAAFRSALAGRRMLVVVDGARSEAQIRPLIPADAGCALLVAYATL